MPGGTTDTISYVGSQTADTIKRAVTDPAYIKGVKWSDRTIEAMETDEPASPVRRQMDFGRLDLKKGA